MKNTLYYDFKDTVVSMDDIRLCYKFKLSILDCLIVQVCVFVSVNYSEYICLSAFVHLLVSVCV